MSEKESTAPGPRARINVRQRNGELNALPAIGNAPAPAQRKDVLNIVVAPAGYDPEEAPVERVHTIGVQLTHGGRPLTGALAGQGMAAAVSEDYGRAGTLAQNLRTRCMGCEHWDRNAAQPYIVATIEKMRSNTVVDQNGVPRSVQGRAAALTVFVNRAEVIARGGLCHAISEVMKNHRTLGTPWITDPNGGCPAPAQMVGPNGEDLSNLYKARERPAHGKTAGDVAYDAILNTAAGKK